MLLFKIATIRKGPPLPSLIFIGSAIILKPLLGNLSKSFKFSNAGMFSDNKITWLLKYCDCPKSMLGVSMPIAFICLCFTNHSAYSGDKPGKCKSLTASLPRLSVPRYFILSG